MARIDGSNRGALVSVDSLRRLSRALQKYEQGHRDIPGVKLRTAFDDGASPLTVCRTAGQWLKGETKELDVIFEDSCDDEGSGAGAGGGRTLEAHNPLFDVAGGAVVLVGQAENGCWYLVQAESSDGGTTGEPQGPGIGGQTLTTIQGYGVVYPQVLGHDVNGNLVWFNTTECDEGSS
jgi:hypothetical protein